MCLRGEEMVHHLLIHCKFAYSVWMALFARLGMQCVMPCSVDELFQQWSFGSKFVHGRSLWKLILYATFWKLWLQSNNRIFKNKSGSREDIDETIIRTVSEWESKKDEFEGISLEDLIWSWVAVLNYLESE